LFNDYFVLVIKLNIFKLKEKIKELNKDKIKNFKKEYERKEKIKE